MTFIQWLISLIRYDMRWFTEEQAQNADLLKTVCGMRNKTEDKQEGAGK